MHTKSSPLWAVLLLWPAIGAAQTADQPPPLAPGQGPSGPSSPNPTAQGYTGASTALPAITVTAPRVLEAERPDDPEAQLEGVGQVLFDAFESAGGARLAAWLELTGETRRLTLVREAVAEVISGPMAQKGVDPERATNLILVAVSLAMGVGLIGRSLAELVGRPPETTREAALAFLKAGLAAALTR